MSRAGRCRALHGSKRTPIVTGQRPKKRLLLLSNKRFEVQLFKCCRPHKGVNNDVLQAGRQTGTTD